MFALLPRRVHVILVILGILLTSVSTTAADIATVQTTYTLTDFHSSTGTRITSLNPNIGASSFKDAVLTCDFSGNPGYIGLGLDVEPLLGTPSAVTLTYESNSSGHTIVLRLQDADGQFFQRQIAVLDSDGVKVVTVPLSDMSTWHHFHGRDDGVVRPPVKVVEVIVDHNGSDTSLRLLGLTAASTLSVEQALTLRMISRKRTVGWETLSVQCGSLLPVAVVGKLSWTITDIFGRATDSGRRTVTLAPGADVLVPVRVRVGDVRLCDVKLDVDVNVTTLGGTRAQPLKSRRETADLDAPVRLTRSFSTSVVAVPEEERRSTDLISDSPFGMGIYLGQRYPIDKMDMVADMGRVIGVKWMRDEFNWGRLEPERGNWRWEPYDKAVDAATRKGISIFGLLCYWAPWTKPYTEEGIRDYCNYVRTVVGRYKGRIKYWEIWNEPNIFFWQGTVEQYTELLKAAYIAVKETDPDARVIGCCTAGTDLKFIERVLELGGYDSMDILSIHPYRYPGLPEQTDFVGELRRADALVRKYGGPKEIWLTEIGWPTNVGSNGSSEAKQAAMIVRTYIQAIVSGVAQKTFWYNYRNDGTDPYYNEHNFGIIRQDYSTKPAYLAFGAMTQALEGKRFARALDMPEGVSAYLFDDTIAAWCVSGTSILSMMSQTPAYVMDIVGKVTVLPPKNGKVVVPLSGFPVFISGLPSDVKVSAATPVQESALADPVSVEVIPTGPKSFSVRLQRKTAERLAARVHVAVPGYADTFDLLPAKQSHTETYDLPGGLSIGDGKPLPVTVTIGQSDRQMSRTSNVSYTLCPRLPLSSTPGPPVDIWAATQITLDSKDDFKAVDGGSATWDGPADLSASVALFWQDDTFILAAKVRDDVFSCEESGDTIWKGDSIQFCIDPGHTEDVSLGRVYEIGLALTPVNGPEIYCWQAPAGERTGPLGADLNVKREGEYTTYVAQIPLSALPSLRPAEGKVVGFSILVNDNDGKGRKGWLEWTPGIGRGKSPALYGDLAFTK